MPLNVDSLIHVSLEHSLFNSSFALEIVISIALYSKIFCQQVIHSCMCQIQCQAQVPTLKLDLNALGPYSFWRGVLIHYRPPEP